MDKALPSVVVALGFLGLIAIVLIITLPRGGEDADSFLKVWAGVGTLVGVAAGAIPSYFFKREADQAKAAANTEAEKAARAVSTNADVVAALEGSDPAAALRIASRSLADMDRSGDPTFT